MTLIKSISGIRGTIGGKAGGGLTPIDVVKYTAAFAKWATVESKSRSIVVGRDARISGDMVNRLVQGTLMGMGIDVIDLGLSTTPTVEMAVMAEQAAGGIILTASHNPKEWNALKLLNSTGEFISREAGQAILDMAAAESFNFVTVGKIGKVKKGGDHLKKHIEAILKLPLVDKKAIEKRKFKIVVDAVNSTGGTAVPMLLEALGVQEVISLYCTPDGNFPHNPEPLPENLEEISKVVQQEDADLGIAVDPDVDRLAFIQEDGEMFGEEYTLVAVADYVLKNKPGNSVSNLSSTAALKDVTLKHGGEYYASAVGEVNVVTKMKEVDAIIGGEGNGGIIYPELHYGRDALVGIALFLTHLATFGKSISMLRRTYPDYKISKNKIPLPQQTDIDGVLKKIGMKYQNYPLLTIDGLKIQFDSDWVHLRKSNTEPIIRIYSESTSQTTAENLARKIMADISDILKADNRK